MSDNETAAILRSELLRLEAGSEMAQLMAIQEIRAIIGDPEGRLMLSEVVEVIRARFADSGSGWNKWMDRIGAERGSKEDLQ